MLKTAKDVVATGDVARIVDFAVEANRLISSTEKELETVKTFLRKHAAEIVAHTSEPSATINGNIGMATVAFPKPCPKAKKGVDLLAAESTMAPELYSLFFRKKVTVEIVDDAEEKMATLHASQRNLIHNLIEVVTSTPRVTVK